MTPPLLPAAKLQGDTPFVWLPDLAGFLARRIRIIVAVTIVGLALAALYLALATPKFKAVAALIIDTQISDPFKQIPITISDSLGASAIVDSQMEILRSHGLTERVVRHLDLADDPEFQSFGGGIISSVLNMVTGLIETGHPLTEPQRIEAATQALSRMIEVRRIAASYVLEIQVWTPSADYSAKLANAVAAEYLGDQINSKRQTAREAEDWLQTGIAQVRDRALAADRAVLAFQEANQIVNLDKLTLPEQQLSDLNADLSTARSRVSEARARFDQVNQVLERGIGDASVSDAIQNAVIVRLRQEYLEAAKRVNEMTERYGADHQAVRRARQDTEQLKAAGYDELERIAQGYRSDLAVATANQAEVQRSYDAQVQKTMTANNLLAQVRDLESSATIYRNLYQNYLQRYTQALQDQSFPVPQARVFTPATPPLKKATPIAVLVLGLAGVGGMAAGLCAAFIRESFDTGLRSAADVSSVTGFDCIALLPRARQPLKSPWVLTGGYLQTLPADKEAAGAPRGQRSALPTLRSDVPAVFADGLQSIRARLLTSRPQRVGARVLGVTSTVAGEGKTTVAVNLAQLLAECGYRTILVDWELRRAGLTRRLAPTCTRGFEDLVRGSADLEDLLVIDRDSGLHILPATPTRTTMEPGLILGSERAAVCLRSLREDYDYVIADLPRALDCADARLIRPMIDEFLLVIESRKTRRKLVEDCLTQGGFDPSRVLGVVLNKVKPKELSRRT